MTRARERHDPSKPKAPQPSRRPKKSDEGLVVLDNPDDGELFETGDNADVAGRRNVHERRPTKS